MPYGGGCLHVKTFESITSIRKEAYRYKATKTSNARFKQTFESRILFAHPGVHLAIGVGAQRASRYWTIGSKQQPGTAA
jgi:hypothetical protein